MKKKLLVILTILLCVLQVSAAGGENKSVEIATIWKAPLVTGSDGMPDLDFTQASKVVQWQREGFLAGLRDGPGNVEIVEVMINEQDNLSQSIRDLADLYNNSDIVLTIGASTDLSTMYSAMVTTFFEIPMLVPFSDGELFSETSQGFAMRLTPTGQRYADFISKDLLSEDLLYRINTILFQDKPVPDYTVKAALFFSDDFNCHESAVMITQGLLDNGLDIAYYKPYPDKTLLTAVRSAWENDKDQVEDADVVILIPKDKDAIVELASIINMWGSREVPPAFILIGYVPEYSDTTVFNSDNVYVLRQKSDKSTCPPDVIHHEGAMGYTAGYITKIALSRALETVGPEPSGWRLWLKTPSQKAQIHETYLESLRTGIVNAIRGINEIIPCFGNVSFLSSDDDRTELELIRYTSVDESVPVDNSELLYRIINRLREKYRITEW